MKLTKEQRELFKKIGSRGGKARAKKMSAAARSKQARKAGNARWAKAKTETANN